MKITAVDPIVLRIPFTDGGSGKGLFPTPWTELEIVLVKITADNGLTGWGEGFGYSCSEAVASMINRALVPLLVGREVRDPLLICEELQRRCVLPGRYGISTFAISGVDIALWDLRAKAEGVPVSALLGKRIRQSVPAYASLVRYGDGDLAVRYAEKALQQGFSELKLHETGLAEIRRCRRAVGHDVPMSVDVNCNWPESFARKAIPELIDLRLRWLEEPVFPPEEFALLANLRKLGLPLAAGENACTAVQFAEMIRLGAVDYLQPSVTKVGGISECNKIRQVNRRPKIPLAPHSPYFGPGYLATLQLASIEEYYTLFEYLYIQPDAWLYRNFPLPEKGNIPIPESPGLGLDPDPEMIARYRVG